MGVRGVDLEPPLDGVAAVLGVRALAQPLRLGHPVEDLGGRAARRLERVERGLDRPVVVQPARELVLVVADRSAGCRWRPAAAAGSPRSSRCRRDDARSRAPSTCPAPDARRAPRRSRRRAPRRRRGSRPCTASISSFALSHRSMIATSRSPTLCVFAIPGAAASCARRAARGDARSDGRAAARRRPIGVSA